MSVSSAKRSAAGRTLIEMTPARLEAVLAIENAAYDVPWSRGNFVDSLASGCVARCLVDDQGAMLGYFVGLAGAAEMHLLNLSVAPPAQHRGHARYMLDALVALCLQSAATQLWLEVRESNERARRLYRRYGFVEVGRRRNYYPGATTARREDAVAMSLTFEGARP